MATLREDRLQKTLPALKQCLEHCQRSPVPMKSLGYFIEGLRLHPGWSEPEVKEIETTARRTQGAILARSNVRQRGR